MSDRSLTATTEGIQQAKIALTDMRLTQTTLATRLGVTRQPIGKFFTGKPVNSDLFVQVCETLKLDWQVIAGVAVSSPDPQPDIDRLVQQTRKTIAPLIQEQCGTMRVLDMEQPIELTGDRGIYTNVNILEKLTRLRSERELLEECGVELFDRLGLGQPIKRLPGLDAVQQHRRLMVLGKPGAGKTTFLKYLAMQCITGNFAADKVPFFVTLKDFAEAEGKPELIDFLAGGDPPTLQQILAAGKALVLLDGLDEVREEDTGRVIRIMRDAADQYPESQFVITCRIAAKEYTFERFTEVEVADFDEQQIAAFAENWFRARNDLPKAETFVQRLKENKPIQELASSPLLLTLLCLEFGESNSFPRNRANLYEGGVKILLKKWDAKRNIQRDELYKKLDVQRREDLLSYVALQAFQQKEYFVKQRRMEGYIADFIGNLRDVDPDPESLRMDSEAVLRSIQAQHGLLVERARGIYSFSHLTFQEYFTAREIAATNPIAVLMPQLSEKRWREVFLLTVGMVRSADELLLAMKIQIDLMLAEDRQLQDFLQWVNDKSASVEVPYKPSAVRAFYYVIALYPDLDRYFDLARLLDRDFDLDSDLDFDSGLASVSVNVFVLLFDFSLTSFLMLDHYLILNSDINLNRALNLTLDLALALASELKLQLQELRDRLPDTSEENREAFNQWWQTNGQQWTEDLRQVSTTHRNIGHDWQFTKAQKHLLQQYYDANLLLIECLNSDGYVSRSVRQEIEDTLLLPIDVLKGRGVK
jgi:predicted NACHT family NTPase